MHLSLWGISCGPGLFNNSQSTQERWASAYRTPTPGLVPFPVFQRPTESQHTWWISLFVPKRGGQNSDPHSRSFMDRGSEECIRKCVRFEHKEKELVHPAAGLSSGHMHALCPLSPSHLSPCSTSDFSFFSVVSFFNNSKGKSQPSPRCLLSLHPHPQFIKNTKCSANHFYEQLSTSVHVAGGSWQGSADKKEDGHRCWGPSEWVPCLLPAPIQCGLCPCSPWRMR